MQDGRVWLLGGEYTGPYFDQNIAPSGEIYDPIKNTWSPIAIYPTEAGALFCGHRYVTSDVQLTAGSPVVTGIYSTDRITHEVMKIRLSDERDVVPFVAFTKTTKEGGKFRIGVDEDGASRLPFCPCGEDSCGTRIAYGLVEEGRERHRIGSAPRARNSGLHVWGPRISTITEHYSNRTSVTWVIRLTQPQALP